MSVAFCDPALSDKLIAYYSDATASPWTGMTRVDSPKGALTDGVELGHHKITSGDTIVEMTAAEKTTVDNEATNLAAHKTTRYAEIDVRTEELILDGFTYQSKTFALDATARESWNGLKVATDAGLIDPATTTQTVGAMNGDTLDLTTAQQVTDLYAAALAVVKGHKESGSSLKKSIFDATDRAGVDAVVDNRT